METLDERIVPDGSAFVWNYTGTGTGAWTTAANWTQDNAPATSYPGQNENNDTVTLPANTANCNVSSFLTIQSLTVAPGYSGTFTVDNIISVTGGGGIAANVNVTGNGNLDIQGGTFSYTAGNITGTTGKIQVDNGTFAISGSAVGTSPQIVITSGAQNNANWVGNVTIANMQNDLSLFGGVQVGGNLTITQQSAITLTGISTSRIQVGVGGDFVYDTGATITSQLSLVTSGGQVEIRQGTFHITQKDSISSYSATLGAGSLIISTGATLSCDYGTNANGGSIQALGNGTSYIVGYLGVHGASSISMSNGDGDPGPNWASLYLTGNFTMDGGTLNIWITPGNGGGYNRLNVTGTVTLGGTSGLVVSTTDEPDNPSYYNIIVATSISGNFGGTPQFNGWSYTYGVQNGGEIGGQVYQLSYPPQSLGGGGGGIG